MQAGRSEVIGHVTHGDRAATWPTWAVATRAQRRGAAAVRTLEEVIRPDHSGVRSCPQLLLRASRTRQKREGPA